MNDNKIKIFIGSSSEAANNSDADKKYLRIISSIVRRAGAEPIAWDKSPSKIFKPGKSTFENLEESITREDINAAIFIYSKDDITWSRGDIHSVARDNVVFEHGLFSGVLGRTKAITVKVGNIKMPSDLYGITCIDYSKNPDDAELEICQWVTELINSEQNNGFKDKSNVINQEIIQEKEDSIDLLSDTVSILKNNFHKIPKSWIDEIKNYILLPFEEMSKGALLGEFVLNTTQYYDSVLTRLKLANTDTKIRAVSLISPELWLNDPHQRRFFEFNVKAKKNGAKIQRLFIATDEQIDNHWTIIQEQIENGFKIKTIHPRIFSDYTKLDDSIMFETLNEKCCYKTTQFYDNPYKLKGARLQLNKSICKEQIDAFDNVWKVAKDPEHIKFQTTRHNHPPGLKMKSYKTNCEVISCEEAATARKVPLVNELKTLILQTPRGLVAAHLPGNGELNLRAIKNTLDIKDIKIANPEDIAKIGLESGTVSAVLEPVWSMPHLISKRLLSLSYVTTNDKTKTGYFKFDPVVLLDATLKIVGNFERLENE